MGNIEDFAFRPPTLPPIPSHRRIHTTTSRPALPPLPSPSEELVSSVYFTGSRWATSPEAVGIRDAHDVRVRVVSEPADFPPIVQRGHPVARLEPGGRPSVDNGPHKVRRWRPPVCPTPQFILLVRELLHVLFHGIKVAVAVTFFRRRDLY